MNVKSPNNTRKWQMGFNSAFKGLINKRLYLMTANIDIIGVRGATVRLVYRYAPEPQSNLLPPSLSHNYSFTLKIGVTNFSQKLVTGHPCFASGERLS
jgi:hypothetical protein